MLGRTVQEASGRGAEQTRNPPNRFTKWDARLREIVNEYTLQFGQGPCIGTDDRGWQNEAPAAKRISIKSATRRVTMAAIFPHLFPRSMSRFPSCHKS